MSNMQPHRSGDNDSVWYADGLQFTCTRCNECCTGPPGYVWLTVEEMERIALHVGLAPDEFYRRYCRRAWWRVSLKEYANGDCILLTPQGCSVYSVRPSQCRTFPFWPDHLRSRQRWEALRSRCPGVGHGRLYSREEIERIAEDEECT
jgi:Fe-S-cluster containining protein